MLEVVHAGREAAANFFRAMRVRDDHEVRLVRFVDDRADFLHRHLILIDQLDDVHAGFGQLSNLLARVRLAFHTPAEVAPCPDRARAG